MSSSSKASSVFSWGQNRLRERNTQSKKDRVGQGGWRERPVKKYNGSSWILGSTLAIFHCIPTFASNKQIWPLTSLPSTLVGVGLGCSSCCEGVLAVWDRPMATLWAGLPEETNNSVRTFLWARSLQAVWLWSAHTHTHMHIWQRHCGTNAAAICLLCLTLVLIYLENSSINNILIIVSLYRL